MKKHIKSTTNLGDPSKQYYGIASLPNMEDGLIIHKLVLTDKPKEYWDHFPLRSFKNKVLMYKAFGIKVNTLKTMLNNLNL